MQGTKAPDFSVANHNKEKRTLVSYRGKWLVLYFYPKDDTSGCTLEGIEFTQKLPEFKKLGATVVGVSPDDSDSHCRFQAKHNLALELLSDPGHAMLEAYGVWKEKSMYGRKYMGVERSTFLIDPQGVIKVEWRKVNVPGHVEEVLKALKTCQ